VPVAAEAKKQAIVIEMQKIKDKMMKILVTIALLKRLLLCYGDQWSENCWDVSTSSECTAFSAVLSCQRCQT